MTQQPDLVGQQFGSYRLLRLLGAGGFAEVYLGEHIDLGTQAAIKVLHTQLSPTDIDTFRTEARTIARLLHPHIIRVLDFNAAGSTPFLVMDYAVGGTMRERYPKGTIVPLDIIVSSIQQVADALQYAHDKKLIHRDIKPENILLDQDHNILLSDFGIALVTQTSHSLSTQNIAGTIAYMAPEQIQAHPRPASDQYSLAIVVYEWLCGQRPFQGSYMEIAVKHSLTPPPPLREKVPTISPEVERVVMTALTKDPKQRFDSVRAFATALQQAAGTGQAHRDSARPLPEDRPQPPHHDPIAPVQAEQAQAIILPHPHANNPMLARLSINIRPPGSLVWSFPTDGLVTSSPTVVNGIVYFGSLDANLYALDAASGQKLWSFLTSNEVYSSPTVVNGIVYFGSDDHNLYALDAISGQKLWSFPTGDRVYSSPTVANGVVYFGSDDGKLYALNAASGQQIWFFRKTWSFFNLVHSSPAIANGVVYFGSNNHLYALDAASGQKIWSFPTGRAINSSPSVINSMVYFGSYDHNFYALDVTSGKKVWSFTTGGFVHSSPTIINGIAYFGSDDRNLYALDAVSGQKIWFFPTDNAIASSPTVANGTVYFGSLDSNLYALNATSGQKRWFFRAGGEMASSPTVVNGVVYVGSSDGYLYAIFA